MATARETTDHDEIREWAESRGGKPAQVEGTGGMLRIDFGDPEQRLEPIDWDRFFEIFDESGLGFLYDPEGHMNKFIQVSRDERGIGKTEPDEKDTRYAASRGARGSRKKSGGTRKKSSDGRKKSSGGSRKKSSGSRKKSTSSSRKKSSGTSRKKSSSASRKKSGSTTRKKSSSASRKKSGSSTRKKSSGTSRKKTSTSRKKSSSKKTSGKKSSSKKSSSKKSSSKKSAGKKSSSKKSGGRKYGRKAGRKVERAMHEMKRGQLRSGSKGPKVKSRKQAIAIGLSEARREGDKVPRRKGGRKKKR